jgi:hypothetical protein
VLHLVQKRGGVPPSSFAEWAAVAAVAILQAVLLSALLTYTALAQEATPGLLEPGDPRSEGSGPGLGSGPLTAAAVVLLIGLAAALATIAYARLARR